YRQYLYIAEEHDDFIAKVDLAVREDDPALRERRIALARENTWTERLQRIEAGIERAHPKASIVVVTYNSLAYTKLCLESLARNPLSPNVEVIVVDNASTDGTPEYLQALADGRAGAAPPLDRFQVILNPENAGFARANNQGLAAAAGHYL